MDRGQEVHPKAHCYGVPQDVDLKQVHSSSAKGQEMPSPLPPSERRYYGTLLEIPEHIEIISHFVQCVKHRSYDQYDHTYHSSTNDR